MVGGRPGRGTPFISLDLFWGTFLPYFRLYRSKPGAWVSPPLLQDPLLAPGRRTFKLRYLVVSFIFEARAETFEEVGSGKVALRISETFAEIIGEGAVVSAADVGISGRLIVFAAGGKNM